MSSNNVRVTKETINTSVVNASYAVRGPIVSKSMELKAMLQQQDCNLPFKEIISCNIGNPQALQQKNLSFIRDVLSLVINPSLKERMTFPTDVIQRADKYLTFIPNAGAYTESAGIIGVRQEVANFLFERDGVQGDPNDIFLTNGASEGVRLCMQTIIRNSNSGFNDGILCPIPQYPLYSALTTLLNGTLIPYYLEEEEAWSCSIDDLKLALIRARESNITPRALVVINPGNPTGQLLSEDKMRELVAFCKKEELCLMADEVYQENVYKTDATFISFRKIAYAMDAFSGDFPLQLISFHSISKGFLGECGLRGGYMELLGFSAEVKAQLYKLASISLCSNTIGQLACGLMVNPPQIGSESYSMYVTERDAILSSLYRRANKICFALNHLTGVTCTAIEGALYAFPRITLSPAAIAAATAQGLDPDAFYCLCLLEETGIVLVPGSGFGQKEGQFHFRTTILPPEDKVDNFISLLTKFHDKFVALYA